MFTTQLAGATPIMKRHGLFFLWQIRRLINGWVATAIAHRVDQLQGTWPRAGYSKARFAVSLRQASPVRPELRR